MITKEEIQRFSQKYKINQTVIFREYLQLWFLSQLYTTGGSERVFFKGGTAIHFLLKSFRFSEDLDFTVQFEVNEFEKLISRIFKKTLQIEGLSIKEKKTITGKSFILVYAGELLEFKVFVSLDFSFREKILSPQKSIFTTDYPIVFTDFVHHLSFEEILAEKIRAILTRKKGRDIFDIWFLLNKGINFDFSLIEEKMSYYPKISWSKDLTIKTIDGFPLKEFEKDLRPFLPLPERMRIKNLYELIKKTIFGKI